MTSPEYAAFAARLAAAPRPPAGEKLDDQRARIEAIMTAIPMAAGATGRTMDIGGVRCEVVEPEMLDRDAALIVYFHGGGFRLCSAAGYRAYASHLATVCAATVVVVDYRLAPEHPYPAALDDAMAVYAVLTTERQQRPIVVAGDSAGGGLAASVVLRSRTEGLRQPDGMFLSSPWADLRNSSPSFTSNGSTDQMFSLESAVAAASGYLDGYNPADPLVSPVLGEWRDPPPTLIHVGSGEVLLDDAVNLANAIQIAGGRARLVVADGMPHIWPTSYPAYPEAVSAVEQIAAFVAELTER